MGENTASGLGGVHVERQPIGGGNVSELSFEIARRIEPLRIQREVKALGGGPSVALPAMLRRAATPTTDSPSESSCTPNCLMSTLSGNSGRMDCGAPVSGGGVSGEAGAAATRGARS